MNPKIVAIICLTAIVVAAIIAMTIVSIVTDRSLVTSGRLIFILALCIAFLGGLTLFNFHHKRRWRLEREDVNGEK